MTDLVYHIPALLSETIDGLNIRPNGIYVDCTFGGGGHSRAILGKLGPQGRLFSFDQDLDAYANVPDDNRFTFVHSNFKYLAQFLRYHKVDKVDGILADLGVSFHHFDIEERGFSFRFDAPLDMRMNMKSSMTAAVVLNTYSEEQLADVFYLYGEIKQSRRLAKVIVNQRNSNPIQTTSQLLEILKPLMGRDKEKKDMARVFQALRIEVNHEMDVLEKMLLQTTLLLKPEGRLAVLTYHSLEDRMVKNFIRSGNLEGKIEKDFYGNVIAPLQAVNNKVIVPSEDEINANPRSRSAKLRIAELKMI